MDFYQFKTTRAHENESLANLVSQFLFLKLMYRANI